MGAEESLRSRSHHGSNHGEQLRAFFDCGRDMPTNASWPATGATLAIFLGVYLKDLFSAWLSPTLAPALLALGALLGVSVIFLSRGRHTLGVGVWFWSIALAWLLSWSATGLVNTSSYYFAIPLALLVLHLNARLFMKLLAVACVTSVVLQIAEYLSEDYLFIFVDRDGAELDHELFGGNVGVFRAKGLAQGPLSAVAFGLWLAFICRKNVLAAALLVSCAFFASGRLGMTIGVLLLAYRLFFSSDMTSYHRWLLLLGVAVLVTVGQIVLAADAARLEFMASAFDTSNEQTEARFFFWLASVELFMNYSPLQMLLGNYGFVLDELGGTENDLLRILLDNGIIGFLPYAVAVGILLLDAVKLRDFEGLLTVFLILMASMLFPFLQSLPSALLFWVYYFSRASARSRLSRS